MIFERCTASPNGELTSTLFVAPKVPDPSRGELGQLLLDRPDFQLRLAKSRLTQVDSAALVQRMYTRRGYKVNTQDDAPSKANQLTLQACSGDHVFGTLTVRDDTDVGLAADALYRQEIDTYRQAGRHVAELTRLAVDPELGSKEVLGALFHAAYAVCGPLRDVTDVLIEVNPRHVGFYRRMLNFVQIGEEKICPRVEAPAVLLHVEVAHVGKQAALYGGRGGEPNQRSLYPYFCDPEAAEVLIQRVLAAAGDDTLVSGPPPHISASMAAARV
jgi:ribosomal protein S18 acetylase RimI-like enzyme